MASLLAAGVQATLCQKNARSIRAYLLDLITENCRPATIKCDNIPLGTFVNMNPDQSDAVQRIISATRCDCSKSNIEAPSTVNDLLKVLEVPDMDACLLSMWLCFCVDKGFNDADFEEGNFDCDQWLDAAEELYEQSGQIDPHVVLVAQQVRL